MSRHLPALWAWLLAAVLTGPALGSALGRGFVLSYDLVWVDDLAWTPTVLGLGSGLPRAVPSDAVVALLDEVVPGAALEALVLLSAIALGGVGVARLLEGSPLATRLVAVTVWIWNPLVVERLVIGHWPVLVGLAVLPWLVTALALEGAEGRPRARCWVLVPLGCLSASAGFFTTIGLVLGGLGRVRSRRLATLAVAGNAPWVVSGLLHLGAATSDPAGAALFGLKDEGALPAPLAALSLGGIWNTEVVPLSRSGPLGPTWSLVLLGLAVLGLVTWWRDRGARPPTGVARTVVLLWVAGYVLALLTWVAPGLVALTAQVVPGGGLLRDGARALVLCVPLVSVLVATGAQRLLDGVRSATTAHRLGPAPGLVAAGLLVGWPLALMPDAALGAGGRLVPVDYPSSWAAARQAIGATPGDVLVLPLTSYRAPSWNGDRPVLDPLPRFLQREAVAADALLVRQGDDATLVAGEDPRVRDAQAALAEPDAVRRSAALAASGIGVVVHDRSAAGEVPPLSGPRDVVGDLEVTVLADPVATRATPVGVASMGLAWTAWLGSLAAGVAQGAARGASRLRDRGTTSSGQ